MALPVQVEVHSRLQNALVNHVEGSLGWQVTAGDDLPPALMIATCDQLLQRPTASLPCILLVEPHDDPWTAARAAAHAGCLLQWPADQDRLVEAAASLRGGIREPGSPPAVTIAGAAGGVGVTTLAMSLAGLTAWMGQPTLAVVQGDVPLRDVAFIEPAALAAHRTWEAATPVPGVTGLRVVHTGRGVVRASAHVPTDVLAVVDRGVALDPDVLVVARDAAGVAAVEASPSGIVLLVDRGPVPARAFNGPLGGRRAIQVDWSARVARAGSRRRVPSSLPGQWLRDLQPLASQLLAQGHRAVSTAQSTAAGSASRSVPSPM